MLAPAGGSVNELRASLATVSEVAAKVAQLGPGALLAKFEHKSDYRQVHTHPVDLKFLGIHRQGVTYIDRALPFGFRSAPIIFTAVAGCLTRVFNQESIGNVIHYLDNFLFWVEPGSPKL